MALRTLTEALALIKGGRAEEAIKDLVWWTRKKPAHLAARYVLAHAFEASERWEEAEAAWKDASVLVSRRELIAPGTTQKPRELAPATPLQLTEEFEADLLIILTPKNPRSERIAAYDSMLERQRETLDPPGPDEEDDLQRLILEMESAPTKLQPHVDDLPPPDLDDDIEGVVSETLARIYASQKQFKEAADVFEELARQHPENAERFTNCAREMRESMNGTDA